MKKWIVFFSLLILNPVVLGNPTAEKTPGNTESPINLSEKNKIEGKHFLEENKKKPGVITLSNGLQYKIEKEGEGASPGPTDFVTVHYRGYLTDGREFDSSYKTKNPATFALNKVIPAWTQALQLMKPGSQWTIYVPSELGYGNKSVGRIIPPNATLIFDIELISVKPTLDTDGDGVIEEEEGH